MEPIELINTEKSPKIGPRSPLADLSNSPQSPTNNSSGKDEKECDLLNLNDDKELLGLIEEHLDKGESSHNIKEDPGQGLMLVEKEKDSSSSSGDEENQLKESESLCSARGPMMRSTKGHSSIFKKQLYRQESRNESKITVYLEHELTDRNIKPGESFSLPQNQSEIVLEGRNSDSLTKFQLALSTMANLQKFDIVRSSRQELLIRKPIYKTIIEQLLMTVKEPLVIQMVLDHSIGKAWIFRVAGVTSKIIKNLNQFKVLMTELQGKLWEAGQLVLSQDEELYLFLCKHQGLMNKLKQVIQFDPYYIKTISDRRKTDLQKNFKKVMEVRENMLTEMHKKGLGSRDCMLELDRFLIKESGLLQSYKEHFKLLQYSYRSRKKSITSQISIKDCLQYLQVQEFEELIAVTQGAGLGKPYQRIMQGLVRVENLGSPQEKLDCLNEIFKDIQQCCNQYHSGKVNLEKMDTMLPVLIYIVLYTDAEDILSNLALLEHYVAYKENSSGNYEQQRRILTNLNVALEYVITSWDYPKKG